MELIQGMEVLVESYFYLPLGQLEMASSPENYGHPRRKYHGPPIKSVRTLDW